MSDNNIVSEERIGRCVFCSENAYSRRVRICCGNYQDVEAYHCEKNDWFPLTNENCLSCEYFIEREEVNI